MFTIYFFYLSNTPLTNVDVLRYAVYYFTPCIANLQ